MPEDKQPPSNAPKNSDPQKPNWGLWFLVVTIVAILGYGLFGNGGFGSQVSQISLADFQKLYQEGRIITGYPKEAPFEVVMSDSSPDATIYATAYAPEVQPKVETIPFKVVFRKDLVNDDFKRLLSRLSIYQPMSGVIIPSTNAEISLQDFMRLANEGMIVGASGEGAKPQLVYDGETGILIGKRLTRVWPSLESKPDKVKVESVFNVAFDGSRVKELLGDSAEYRTETSSWKSILINILPILMILLIIFFIFRAQSGGGPRAAMNFSKSRARLMVKGDHKVTFKDVAGISEAKEEVWEIVEYLRHPEKFRKLGGMIPKGVLMVGPPGTGKTLLARAIAGEADVPFFTISGSDFVEMFVGVGASRVRDLFNEAKKNAPCLIFIDEIDAVGRHRGHGVGGGHDEREQTLNALLVEMDGFTASQNVIVVAATNRRDVLDPALLRPGRFDREVQVHLPDVKGREQILRVHSKKIKLADNTDMKPVARSTTGFSGAELANLINEAALLAARKDLEAVTLTELEEARDKVRWGRERRSLSVSDKERRVTAVHEAGHAICLLKTENSAPLHKVTVIPRGNSLGSTMWLPEEDQLHSRRSEMLDMLVVGMGGRVAEEVVFNDITSGASGDISMVTALARRMVCEYGMSEKLGTVEYGSNSGEVFLARDIGHNSKNYSDKTAELIDTEIQAFVRGGYDKAHRILEENRQALDVITDALIEYETLDGAHIREILDNGYMSTPPDKSTPPPLPEDDDTVIAPSLEVADEQA